MISCYTDVQRLDAIDESRKQQAIATGCAERATELAKATRWTDPQDARSWAICAVRARRVELIWRQGLLRCDLAEALEFEDADAARIAARGIVRAQLTRSCAYGTWPVQGPRWE